MISTWTPTPIPNYPSPGQQGWIPPPPACLLDALNTCQPGPPAYRPSILQTLLFLKKLCGLTFFLQTEVIHGLIRGFTLQDFPVSSVEISAFLGCHTILWVYLSGTDQAHSARTYHWRLERTWHFDTPWDSPFQQIYEDLSHILFGVPLGIVPGWWDDRERNHKRMLPLYLRLDISDNHSRAISCLCLSGHNFWSKERVIIGIERLMSSGYVTIVTGTLFRMRNTICWTVAWMSCQPSHTAPPACLPPLQYEESPTLVRTFLNQPDIWCGLFFGWVPTSSPFSLIFSSPFLVWLQAFSKRNLTRNKRKDSAGSDDTASMIKGGGYVGARTRQPSTHANITKLMWVRGVVCHSTQTQTLTVVAYVILQCLPCFYECRSALSDGVFIQFRFFMLW